MATNVPQIAQTQPDDSRAASRAFACGRAEIAERNVLDGYHRESAAKLYVVAAVGPFSGVQRLSNITAQDRLLKGWTTEATTPAGMAGADDWASAP